MKIKPLLPNKAQMKLNNFNPLDPLKETSRDYRMGQILLRAIQNFN